MNSSSQPFGSWGLIHLLLVHTSLLLLGDVFDDLDKLNPVFSSMVIFFLLLFLEWFLQKVEIKGIQVPFSVE